MKKVMIYFIFVLLFVINSKIIEIEIPWKTFFLASKVYWRYVYFMNTFFDNHVVVVWFLITVNVKRRRIT